MTVAIMGTGFFSFLAGFTCAWYAFRRRGYQEGWNHGENFGRVSGYRQAWLKHMRYRHAADLDQWIRDQGGIEVLPCVDPQDDHTW